MPRCIAVSVMASCFSRFRRSSWFRMRISTSQNIVRRREASYFLPVTRKYGLGDAVDVDMAAKKACAINPSGADSLDVESALCTVTICETANGQSRRDALQAARIMRSGRRMMRQPVSATFIQGFHGAINRRRVLISLQNMVVLSDENSGPPSAYHSSTRPYRM